MSQTASGSYHSIAISLARPQSHATPDCRGTWETERLAGQHFPVTTVQYKQRNTDLFGDL